MDEAMALYEAFNLASVDDRSRGLKCFGQLC